MIVRAQELYLITGFTLNTNSESNPLLQYVDDTTIFINYEVDAADNLKVIMFWFGQISGLQIDEKKSKIIPGGQASNIQ